jgi:hypothetical protein
MAPRSTLSVATGTRSRSRASGKPASDRKSDEMTVRGVEEPRAASDELESESVEEVEELESELEDLSDDDDVELPAPGAAAEDEEESEW